MESDDRFDDLVASLGGFYRSWLVYLGLELGLFRRLREAADAGMTPAELAEATGARSDAIEVWAWAADVHGLVTYEDGRITGDAEIARILLDDRRREFLGGQFVHAVVASMDWDRMPAFFRSGRPFHARPDRYRRAIERLTVQDIAVFFQEGLAAMPQLVSELSEGRRVLDVHCGGGRWMIAMAQRFPGLELIGAESEPDSVARARWSVEEAGLVDRIRIDAVDLSALGYTAEFDLVYFQYALHQLPEAASTLRSARVALRPGGRLLVMDWPLPTTDDELRTRHGELIAGVQLDEVLQGTRLETREWYQRLFKTAGLPEPEVIDLPSGASMFVVTPPG